MGIGVVVSGVKEYFGLFMFFLGVGVGGKG